MSVCIDIQVERHPIGRSDRTKKIFTAQVSPSVVLVRATRFPSAVTPPHRSLSSHRHQRQSASKPGWPPSRVAAGLSPLHIGGMGLWDLRRRLHAVTRVNSTNVLDEGLRIGEIGRRMNSKVRLVEIGVYRK
jgi:hypothetical protein